MEYSDTNITENENFQIETEQKSHTKRWILLGAVALFVLLLFITCPDKSRHKEAIMKEVKEAVRTEFSSDDGVIGMFGNMLTGGIIGIAIDNTLDVDYYGVCSVGRIGLDDKSKVVSFGILGHVFTSFDSDDLKEKIDSTQL